MVDQVPMAGTPQAETLAKRYETNASLTFVCSVFILLLLTHLVSVPVLPNTLNLDVVIPKKYLSVYTLYNLKHPLSTFD